MPQASGPRKRPGNAPRQGAKRPAPKKKRPVNRKKTQGGLPSTKSGSASNSKNSLSKLLSPENIQDTVKSVGNLRTQVKKWMGYLQQADQVLDTVFFTTNSLRDTGVLDKIVKQRGKNLSTEDFTNILVALMNSPAGSQILKSMGGGESDEGDSQTEVAPANQQQAIQGQTASAQRRAGNGRRPARRNPGLPPG